MDELEDKLNSGNPLVATQIVSKLAQIVKNKATNDIFDLVEYKFLKNKSITTDNALNTLASEAILSIVRNEPSLVKSVITDFITVITTTKFSPNIAYLINNLLLIELETNSKKYNLCVPQHPFIVMLNEDAKSWSAIFREIAFCYRNSSFKMISQYNELYKPVFLYILCDPDGERFLSFKQKLWSFVINNNSEIINILLSWLQFENPHTLQINSEFLMELSEFDDLLDVNLLLLWQISTLHQLILNKFDPREIILTISETLEKKFSRIILNPILLILSKSINLCSGVFLLPLLELCRDIIERAECDVITANVIKSVLLQLIANPSDLISQAIISANKIFVLLETESIPRLKGFLNFFKTRQDLIISNRDVYFSLQIFIILEKCKNDKDIETFLNSLEKSPEFFLSKLHNFLLGLFITDFAETTITSKVFSLILKCIDFNKNLAASTLTVMLYKLTKTTDSKLHYQILKALPRMAINKNNFFKVVSTIQALNKGHNSLKTFSTSLMLDLWKINGKSYTYLEKFLVAPYSSSCNKWEFFITRAHILKELCALKPELYGKDMVAHLSKILNDCNNPDGAVASALAIEGIRHLCKSEIIDAVTTWATLEPMFQDEARVPVICSLCGLISEIPTLSYIDTYPELVENVVNKLWQYLILNPDDNVWKAALNVLSHFTVDQIVAQIPDDFLDEELINLRKNGNTVPGNCWIRFLKNCNKSKLRIVGDFLIKIVSLEVSGYLKFVYQVKGIREPVDYTYLPVNSVVRGILTYIKSNMFKWKNGIYKEIYLECLRIFSQEYSKPLPPLDWCFLQELFHETETKSFCISIAAHQVVLSGTARRFIVNYIEAMDLENEKDILHIYNNLKYLANSVQPFTLKPFLEKTILTAVNLFKTGQETQLNEIINYLKDTLRNEGIQEANKTVIANIITEILIDLEITSKLFEVFLDCVILFPPKSFNDLTSPNSVKEIQTDWFKKSIKIRCSLALITHETPLNLLNELIEHGYKFPNLKQFMFENFVQVFQKHQNSTECVLWVLELIGQIQALTVEKRNEQEIKFLCDVFVLSSVVFSGHLIFLENFEKIYEVFPQAVATLFNVNHWSICTTQALEWFYHIYTEKILSREYTNVFLLCLKCLRHESEFCKNMKWTKYLNVEC